MPYLPLLLIVAWAVLTGGAFFVGAWRAKRFEADLARAGFTAVDEAASPPDVFRRPEATVSRVVRGTIAERSALFVFGRCRGRPVFFEGILDMPRIPVAAVILRVQQPSAWIETWTSDRAYALGWRPAQTAEHLNDGRIALVWEEFSHTGRAFDACRTALVRTPAA